MSGYISGALYRATVCGEPNVVVAHRGNSGAFPWLSVERDVEGANWHYAADITDAVGPLRVVEPGQVVLDLGATRIDHSAANWSDVVGYLRNTRSAITAGLIADQIEAQTKPKRIPEPGLWGVVDGFLPLGRDGEVPLTFVRHQGGWVTPQGELVEWDRILRPVLVREGVDS